MIPAKALCQVHLDPEQPTPSVGDGFRLAGLPAEAIDTLVRVAEPPLLAAELILIGGEMKHARPSGGALAAIDAEIQNCPGGRSTSSGYCHLLTFLLKLFLTLLFGPLHDKSAIVSGDPFAGQHRVHLLSWVAPSGMFSQNQVTCLCR